MTQLALAFQGEANKNDAMARAWNHANPEWKQLAYQAVRQLARSRAVLTTDDVWDSLAGFDTCTHDHRALGPVMRQAARDGWIAKTDRVVPTTRPCANRRPVAVWQSLQQSQPLTTTVPKWKAIP